MSTRCRAVIVAVLAAMLLAVLPAAPVMARMLESATTAPSPRVDPLRAFGPSVRDARSHAESGSPDMGAREGTATGPWETPPGSDDDTGTPGGMRTPREASRVDTAAATVTVVPARETTPSAPVVHGFSDHSVMYPDAVGTTGVTIAYGVDGTEKTYVLRQTRDSVPTMSSGDQPQQEDAATPTKDTLSARPAARAISVEGAASPRRRNAAAKTTQRGKARFGEQAEMDEPSTDEGMAWGRITSPWRSGLVEIPLATLASLQLDTPSDRFAFALFDT